MTAADGATGIPGAGSAQPLGGRLLSGAGFLLLRFALSAIANLGINLYVMSAYPLHEVGYLSILLVIAALVAQLADFGVGASMVQSGLPVGHSEATGLLSNILLLWLPIAILASLIAFLERGPLSLMCLVLALTVPLTAMRLISSATVERNFGFAKVASLEMAETAALAGVVFLTGFLGLGVWGYVLGCVARAVVGYTISSRLRSFGFSLALPRWDGDWRRALRFGMWYHAVTIMNALRTLVLPLSLASLIGLTAAGIVDRAVFLASAPALVLGTIQQRLLFPFFAATQADPVRRRVAFEKALHLSACVDKLLYLPLLLLLGPCVQRYLATPYLDLVPLVWVLALANAAFVSLASTAWPVLNGLGRSDIVAWVNISCMVLTWALAWPLVHRFGMAGAVAANMSAWLGVGVVVVILRRQLPGVRLSRRVGAPLVAFLIALAAGWLTSNQMGSERTLGHGLCGVLAALVCYPILLVAIDRQGTIGLVMALRELLRRPSRKDTP